MIKLGNTYYNLAQARKVLVKKRDVEVDDNLTHLVVIVWVNGAKEFRAITHEQAYAIQCEIDSEFAECRALRKQDRERIVPTPITIERNRQVNAIETAQIIAKHLNSKNKPQ